MKGILLVGAGGFVGAALRYAVSTWFVQHTASWRFPAVTFLVNVLGCLAAGILMALATKQGFFSPNTRLVLFFGLLGGFTTFSAFGLEAVHLIQRQEFFCAALYVFGTVLAGLVALWLGMSIVR